ncbi:putative fatty acyl-CoA reductase CG5065 [Anticarsia gemmatalis]|uniref:putative fatty acyl-CoA reductase CG5065 n=1 Tax=Anticarsia gemmatalis TaxID=129554 RepID=UPI003F762F33
MVPRPAPQSPSPPLIPQYFAGREVFITGATGFMGKVLVERLLWTCPEVGRLHLLLRRKKDVAPEKRLKKLKQSQVFDVIRQQCPQRLDKLCIVAGDVTKPKLGMSRDAIQELSQVSVVFHSAATLKFDEPLGAAVEQNLRSVLTLMDICDQLPAMQVFVHVSTAYSNADLAVVEERVYPAPASLHQLLTLVDNLPEHLLAEITPKLISPKPNTYTFTKAMAESAVAERAHSARYATAIFRPSIVISSLAYPFPGWIENLNGPSGVMVGAGKGLLHVLHCAGHKRADMIPVDIVIDTLIAAAWEVGIEDSREARVYNCCSNENPTTWAQFKQRMLRGVRRHPFDTPLWYPSGFFTESKTLVTLTQWLLQTAPLHTIDFLYTMCGVKPRPRMSTVSSRLAAMSSALRYFTTHEWSFSTTHARRLRQRLAPADNNIYNLDPNTIDWDEHCVSFVKGTRKYLLLESDKDIDKAQARMKMLLFIHRTMQCMVAFFMCRLAIRSAPAILRAIATLMTFRKNARKVLA